MSEAASLPLETAVTVPSTSPAVSIVRATAPQAGPVTSSQLQPLTLGRMPSSAVLASLGLQAATVSLSSERSTLPPLFSGGAFSAGCRPMLHSSLAIAPSHQQGFSLGHGFPLIPPKMVTKIEQFEFFSMAELLPDNVELSRKTEAVSAPSTCLPKVPKKGSCPMTTRDYWPGSYVSAHMQLLLPRNSQKRRSSSWHIRPPLFVELFALTAKGGLAMTTCFANRWPRAPSV